MPGGASGQKQKRIAFADFIGFFRGAEQFVGIGELAVEFIADFLADLVTAGMNAGTDGGEQVAGVGVEPAAHLADTFFDNSLDSAAPSGVESANRTVFRVYENDGKA